MVRSECFLTDPENLFSFKRVAKTILIPWGHQPFPLGFIICPLKAQCVESIQTVSRIMIIVCILQEGVSQLESYKFIPLMYQLAARMSLKNLASDSFQEVLQEVSSENIFGCILGCQG